MLIDSFAIPAAMVVSAVFLHARYTKMHGAGVLLCVTGLALTIVSDLGESIAIHSSFSAVMCQHSAATTLPCAQHVPLQSTTLL
jgi:drug/metabolite transporter (DMT)-like permease